MTKSAADGVERAGTSGVNTLEVDPGPVATALARSWPDLGLEEARLERGAFHLVFVSERAAVRVCFGRDHEARSLAEIQNAVAFGRLGLPFNTPVPQREPVTTVRWTAAAYTVVDGASHRDDGWRQARLTYLPILEALRSIPPHSLELGRLRDNRDWCGGDRWADITDELVASSAPELAALARSVVRRVLDAEQQAANHLVHGDLSRFNVLVSSNGVGLVDVDHAAVGDPAVDLVWLVRAFSSRELAADLDRAELVRAQLYGWAGPLRIAAAARLLGDRSLELHALANFVKRAPGIPLRA